jgi:two-component system response regulator YesN
MIVDDMEIVRLQLKRLKVWGKDSGFQITDEAANGYEALLKLQDQPVDLLITDILMPVVDGVELLEKVVEKQLASCVVLLSEYDKFEYARKGLVLGAFDYLVKPVNTEDIRILLERAESFIQKKEETQKKLNLQENSFYITQILELFENDIPANSLAGSVFDGLISSKADFSEIYQLVKSFLDELIKNTNSYFAWYTKFEDTGSIKHLNYYAHSSIERLRDDYIYCVENVQKKISSLYFGRRYGALLNDISIFILKNVEDELKLTAIANFLNMNKNYLCGVFKKKTGIYLLDYITKVKMERAKKLLTVSEFKSYEISEKLGYKDPEYFSRLFKKYEGISPTEYRRKHKNQIHYY